MLQVWVHIQNEGDGGFGILFAIRDSSFVRSSNDKRNTVP